MCKCIIIGNKQFDFYELDKARYVSTLSGIKVEKKKKFSNETIFILITIFCRHSMFYS